MGPVDRLSQMIELRPVMQVAGAAAVGASKPGHGFGLAGDGPGHFALQVLSGGGGGRLHQGSQGKEVVDMPAPGFSLSPHDLHVSVHPPKAGGGAGRSGIGVVALQKLERAQGPHGNLLAAGQVKDKGIDAAGHGCPPPRPTGRIGRVSWRLPGTIYWISAPRNYLFLMI